MLDAAVPDHAAADALRSRFDAAVHAAGFDDLASTQAAYARRLAEAPGQLAYEEMHKLFSLVAELHALERLGYSPAVNSVDELREGLRARFAEQRRVARMVAEDRVQDGLRNLWMGLVSNMVIVARFSSCSRNWKAAKPKPLKKQTMEKTTNRRLY